MTLFLSGSVNSAINRFSDFGFLLGFIKGALVR
jgi:hypothetical protein